MNPTGAWAALSIVVLVLVGIGWERIDRRRRLRVIRERWAQWRDVPRDMATIGRYFHASATADPTQPSIDERTWLDLNLDDVFKLLDRTSSLVGQQALYVRLRTSPTREDLAAFESLVTRFSQETALRERAQLALDTLRQVDGHDIRELVQPGTLDRSAWHVVFPLMGVAMFATAVAVPFFPFMLLVLIAGTVVNLALRATAARRLQLVSRSFRQIDPLLGVASALRNAVGDDRNHLVAPFQGSLRRLTKLRRTARWAGRDSSGAASGNLGLLIIEYLNLMFCLDGIALFSGSRELQTRAVDLLRVVDAVGNVDASISIASYRAATPGWTHPVFVAVGAATVLKDVRHPLVPNAIPNSLVLAPPHGVLITGSNMSGKSTFLRTLGVTAVLAQSINTCLATVYEAPPLIVRSCIGRADDPASGRSYYLVEVESVLDLVHTARVSPPMLMLFDELFRGTNTVERVAAGESVLISLLSAPSGELSPRHIVVAATHDGELVDLLASRYAAFHFADVVDDHGLNFDYRLHPGPATSRNAITLLRLRGAPADLVDRAIARVSAMEKITA